MYSFGLLHQNSLPLSLACASRLPLGEPEKSVRLLLPSPVRGEVPRPPSLRFTCLLSIQRLLTSAAQPPPLSAPFSVRSFFLFSFSVLVLPQFCFLCVVWGPRARINSLWVSPLAPARSAAVASSHALDQSSAGQRGIASRGGEIRIPSSRNAYTNYPEQLRPTRF